MSLTPTMESVSFSSILIEISSNPDEIKETSIFNSKRNFNLETQKNSSSNPKVNFHLETQKNSSPNPEDLIPVLKDFSFNPPQLSNQNENMGNCFSSSDGEPAMSEARVAYYKPKKAKPVSQEPDLRFGTTWTPERYAQMKARQSRQAKRAAMGTINADITYVSNLEKASGPRI
ncbi:MAG: hypothetical protein M1818_002901 [Claussenomyces sp. TS43310]|nr:MAG: hypothetical protein M1818_002901 [Claussenomyces sp. TS43310]